MWEDIQQMPPIPGHAERIPRRLELHSACHSHTKPLKKSMYLYSQQLCTFGIRPIMYGVKQNEQMFREGNAFVQFDFSD